MPVCVRGLFPARGLDLGRAWVFIYTVNVEKATKGAKVTSIWPLGDLVRAFFARLGFSQKAAMRPVLAPLATSWTAAGKWDSKNSHNRTPILRTSSAKILRKNPPQKKSLPWLAGLSTAPSPPAFAELLRMPKALDRRSCPSSPAAMAGASGQGAPAGLLCASPRSFFARPPCGRPPDPPEHSGPDTHAHFGRHK